MNTNQLVYFPQLPKRHCNLCRLECTCESLAVYSLPIIPFFCSTSFWPRPKLKEKHLSDFFSRLRLESNLELAPISNKCPASNKSPPYSSLPIPLKLNKAPTPTTPTSPPPPPPTKKNWISSNKRLPRRRRFLQSTLQKPALLHLRVFFLPFIVLLQNKRTTLAENVNKKNLISAQPRINAHLE